VRATSRRRRPPQGDLDPQRLAEIGYHATAQRAVECWWNARRFQPELAAKVKAELPDLAALEELGKLVMPKGPAL
jgi:hypothetical protein